MKSKRRRKSSDEVIVEIQDAEGREKNYWNLRGEKNYNYTQEDSSENLRDELSIEFNLNENRNLTPE